MSTKVYMNMALQYFIALKVKSEEYKFYGQTKNGSSWARTQLNMVSTMNHHWGKSRTSSLLNSHPIAEISF